MREKDLIMECDDDEQWYLIAQNEEQKFLENYIISFED